MTPTVILAVLAGLGLGSVIGHAKFKNPLFGAVAGALCAGVPAFVFTSGPGTVVAVETFDDFEELVLNSKKPVLVDFYADWCGPCRQLAPTIDELADQYAKTIKVVKIDVQKAPQIAHEYGIRGIPNVFLFVDGEPVYQWLGARPRSVYERAIDSVLAE